MNNYIRQGVEVGNRASLAHFGPLNAQFLGLAIDAFSASALGGDGMGERTVPIQRDARLSAAFPVDILDTARTFSELLLLTGLACLLGTEQGAAEVASAQ